MTDAPRLTISDFRFRRGSPPQAQEGVSRLDISQNLQTSPTIRAVVKGVLWLIWRKNANHARSV